MLPPESSPTCADPAYLPLIDAAFARPGGPAADHLARKVCPHCPVAAECLEQAMATGEHGPWGGTSRKARTTAGAPEPATTNMGRNHDAVPD